MAASSPTEDKANRYYKLPIIGDVEAGKTSLLLRFVENRFSDEPLVSLDADYKVKEIIADGEKVTLQIW